MKKYKVLVDLNVAMNNGYCGIANDNRLIFKLFAQIQSLQLSGLLISDNPTSVFTKYSDASNKDPVKQANRFFHEALHHELLLKNKILSKLKLTKLFALKKNKFDLFDIDPLFQDVIWRNVFDKTIKSFDKNLILQNDFHYSDLTAMHVYVQSYFNRKTKLNTSGHDFVLFLEPTTVTVSPNTKKIVRYHDAIPITEPDLTGSIFSHRNINILNACAEDSYFVCNSEPTRQSLLALKPQLETKSFTIPVCISNQYQKVTNHKLLRQILTTRLSSQLINMERLQQFQYQILCENELNYILHLATLDPKKNQINLIKAWEKLNYKAGEKVKLVIAANRGWFSQEIETIMRPHVERGDIIHLNNVASDEIPYLYSHAKAFVFPSFIEGFGLPPVEAMQCECPTIVSDIPTHRWVMGDAALFCDPYDTDSICEAIAKLLYYPDAKELSAKLISNGIKQVKRYSEAALQGQWADLLERIANRP